MHLYSRFYKTTGEGQPPIVKCSPRAGELELHSLTSSKMAISFTESVLQREAAFAHLQRICCIKSKAEGGRSQSFSAALAEIRPGVVVHIILCT